MSSVDPSQPDQPDQPGSSDQASQPEATDWPGQPEQPGQPATTPTPAAAAPGWYADPSGTGGTRWWDGTAWTQNVQPPAPAPAPQPAYPPAPATPPAPGYGAAPGYAAAPVYGAAPGYAPAYQGGYVQPRQVGFAEAVRRAFAGWSDYSGRATVAEYWWFVLFQVLIALPLYLLFVAVVLSSFSTTTSADGTASVTSTGLSALGILLSIVMAVVYLALLLVGLALAVRRLHDSDKSGWWYLITFVPFGSLVLLIFFILPGTPGPNRWGPVPQ